MSQEYVDQVVVIAGGADGIGRAIARGFKQAGASVVVAGPDPDCGIRLVAALDDAGPRSIFAPVDVSDSASVVGLARTVEERLGRADILINCAATGRNQDALSISGVDWSRSLDVILTGTFYCSQAFAPLMAKQKKGTIVNIASMDAFHAFPGRAGYAAAAAGVLGLTRALAVEWASLGIRVNALAPGLAIAPDLERPSEGGRAPHERLVNRTPMHRLARPDEVASAALFLAGPRAAFMTGQVLRVDGGWAALNSAAPGLVFP